MTDFLPCPFCGMKPSATAYSLCDVSSVECLSPSCSVKPAIRIRLVDLEEGSRTAKEIWNRRAPAIAITLPQRYVYTGDGAQSDTFNCDDVIAALRAAGLVQRADGTWGRES